MAKFSNFTKESLTQLIYDVVDEFNENSFEGSKLQKSLDTELFGPKKTIDSLDLVDIITAVEEKVDSKFNIPISLEAEDDLAHFQTLETLRDRTFHLLKARINI
ncbi:MAG: hypothetical protein HYW47_01810 [Deltaproteobacteria bacterium]|nr:hypothetical protein [Deltaproteobacteria bacterium]